MAISNRSRDLIERSLRPGSQSAEIITALNNAALTTVLSHDAIQMMKKHVSHLVGTTLASMLRAGSKASLSAAKGQDAWLKHALFHWLKDRDVANDLYNQVANTV